MAPSGLQYILGNLLGFQNKSASTVDAAQRDPCLEKGVLVLSESDVLGGVVHRVLVTAALPERRNLLRKPPWFFVKHLFSQTEHTARQAGASFICLGEEKRLAGLRKGCSVLISCAVKAGAYLRRAV